jgi:hypothetical protein
MEYEEHFELGRRVGATITHPYLDSDLVEFLYRVSPAALTAGGRTKGMVREAVARRFPTLGFDRHKKISANSFYRGVLEDEGPAAWRQAAGLRALADLGIVDAGRFGRIVDDIFAGRRPGEQHLIWNVLNVNGWVRARIPTAQARRVQ